MSSNCEHVLSMRNCSIIVLYLLLTTTVTLSDYASFVQLSFLPPRCGWHQEQFYLFFFCIVYFAESVGWIYQGANILPQGVECPPKHGNFLCLSRNFLSHLIKLLCSSSHWFFDVVGFLVFWDEWKVFSWKFDVTFWNAFLLEIEEGRKHFRLVFISLHLDFEFFARYLDLIKQRWNFFRDVKWNSMMLDISWNEKGN